MENKTIKILLVISICFNVFFGLSLIGVNGIVDDQEKANIQLCEYSNDLIDLTNNILEENYEDPELLDYLECWK